MTSKVLIDTGHSNTKSITYNLVIPEIMMLLTADMKALRTNRPTTEHQPTEKALHPFSAIKTRSLNLISN